MARWPARRIDDAVIVYRSSEIAAHSHEALHRLRQRVRALERAAPTHASAVELLIDAGMFEAGVIDGLAPNRDDVQPIGNLLRRVCLLAAHVVHATWHGRDAALAIERLACALREIPAGSLPREITWSTPEGYAYYGLYPEQYLEAAARFAAEIRPDRVACIGLRSIGTSLSAVVGATLEVAGATVVSWTVRPRGHPWARRLDVGGMLDREWRSRADWRFVIVDEGPGISGSSFACVAEALGRIGVPDDAVALFPSWVPDGESFSDTVARRWRAHSKWHASFEDVWLASGRLGGVASREPFADISAGRWRSVLLPPRTRVPAVHGHHERRKLLTRPDADRPRLFKFAGLGTFGRRALERARRLADAGWGPEIDGLTDGFMVMSVVCGTPVDSQQIDAEFLTRIAEYLAFVGATFPAAGTVPCGALMQMIETNIAEGLGPSALSGMRRLERERAAVEEAPLVAIDGRMLPHEWLRTAAGLVKTDGVDHHCDHFWPGCLDVAWDLAATLFEFDLDRDGQEYFLSRYARIARDTTLERRLPFYRVAYLSYRLGYATLSARTAPEEADRRRFAAVAAQCRGRLASELVSE